MRDLLHRFVTYYYYCINIIYITITNIINHRNHNNNNNMNIKELSTNIIFIFLDD